MMGLPVRVIATSCMLRFWAIGREGVVRTGGAPARLTDAKARWPCIAMACLYKDDRLKFGIPLTSM